MEEPQAHTAGGVYSNTQIFTAHLNGHIVCEPFNPDNVSHASLDVTLGYYYFRAEQQNRRTIYNPFDREDVERYFDGPYKAMPHKKWIELHGFKPLLNIPDDHPVIAVGPNERILAHTHEFFGIKPPGAFTLHARSSWARNGVAVCFDAGWVDPGYINRLTLEIYNLNEHETVLIPVGERIAQAVFHHTGKVDGDYGLGRKAVASGKYQQGTDLENLIKTWTPDMMLPRSYLDTRRLPLPIEGCMYD
ncbi:deoxycytidine triphosphate deaminase [Candidatus Saccharibacteria bacterium]|nr:deoxycytidine triphosphate deaminase [Candidatus Saccharibacteria bacterium]MCB9821505.1 deoxycytidine triphosphate deaminase [Candidatus Nomurabacteria bacterium]